MADARETTSDATAAERDESEERESLLAEVLRHPLPSLLFVCCVLLGAVLATFYLPEDIALARRVVGGAILGGLSWLLVMVGRIIGG